MAYLPPSTLASVAQTSRWGDLLVGPHLTRDVHLSRSSDQVIDFCRYALTKNLATNIKELHIEGHAIDESTECARALSYLLNRTSSLRSFFRSTPPDSARVKWSYTLPFINRMITAEPPDNLPTPHPLLVQALRSHPPSERLSLGRVLAPQLALLSPMGAGLCRLRSLSLYTESRHFWNPHGTPDSVTPEVDLAHWLTRLLNSLADSLTELTLIGILPPPLFEGTKDPPIFLFPHVRSLRLEFRREYRSSNPDDPKLSLERIATAFPHLRHLTANFSETRNATQDPDDCRGKLPADLPLVALKTSQSSTARFGTVQLSHVHFSRSMSYPGDGGFERYVRPFKAQLRGIIVAFHCRGSFISLLEWLDDFVGYARFLHLLVALELEPTYGIKALTQSVSILRLFRLRDIVDGD